MKLKEFRFKTTKEFKEDVDNLISANFKIMNKEQAYHSLLLLGVTEYLKLLNSEDTIIQIEQINPSDVERFEVVKWKKKKHYPKLTKKI